MGLSSGEILNDVISFIPCFRPPPVKTLQHYRPPGRLIILADPAVYDLHCELAPRGVEVVIGERGLLNQISFAYRLTIELGYRYFWRMDDDLGDKTFVTREGYADLTEVMAACRRCAEECRVTLVGPRVTTNRTWLSGGWARGYAHVAGAAQLCVGSSDPYAAGYMSTQLRGARWEDVYRGLAHRRKDGAIGVVKCIGIKMQEVVGNTSLPDAGDDVAHDRDLILEQFAGMATCDGYRNGYPNWRMQRGGPTGFWK